MLLVNATPQQATAMCVAFLERFNRLRLEEPLAAKDPAFSFSYEVCQANEFRCPPPVRGPARCATPNPTAHPTGASHWRIPLPRVQLDKAEYVRRNLDTVPCSQSADVVPVPVAQPAAPGGVITINAPQ